jgi:hypothetical protein
VDGVQVVDEGVFGGVRVSSRKDCSCPEPQSLVTTRPDAPAGETIPDPAG